MRGRSGQQLSRAQRRAQAVLPEGGVGGRGRGSRASKGGKREAAGSKRKKRVQGVELGKDGVFEK